MKSQKPIWTDRTLKTLALALAMIVTMGLLRPDKPKGIPPKKYWAKKIAWKHCADVVLTGDSRTFMSLSPKKMQEILTKTKILNYG